MYDDDDAYYYYYDYYKPIIDEMYVFVTVIEHLVAIHRWKLRLLATTQPSILR